MEYNHAEIEKKCKSFWKENDTYKVTTDTSKPKYYVLDMFPYPSGAGLHVGHPLGYIASDIFARYKRQSGFNVLHPMGYDAFGLPAEQYAIQTGVHPADSTNVNLKRYRKQLDNIGFNYDWSRQVKTCDPSYYKWTQWIFIQLFEHYYDNAAKKALPISSLTSIFSTDGSGGVKAAHASEVSFTAEEWKSYSEKEQQEILMNYRLAYRKVAYVNWCEALGTVLANDEVKDGFSERGGHPVTKKPMLQWALRITAYVERLLEGLTNLDWSDSLKSMQRNWIGKSTGATVYFEIKDSDQKIEVFTTRPDTIFGVTYMVLAPDHEWVDKLCHPDQAEAVKAYKKATASKSDLERMSEQKTVSGQFIGRYAVHPITKESLPIYIAEYVLKDYGTGAIMAVPSDDARDRRFAEKYDLPIIEIVDKSAFPNAKIGDKVGTLIHSEFLNGLTIKKAIKAALAYFYDHNFGERKVNYKLRDANFSRQRYWGEPFPITYKNGIASAVPIDELPVTLPDLDDFKPTAEGKSPLARVESWFNTEHGIRETDTMPGYAGSSWYFLRYMDAHNDDSFVSKEALDYWQEVDLYIGGTEHAVGHLMYSRFWHKFLYDLGYTKSEEPFKKLINQGMIQGVIEYLYLAKEKENGVSKFVCSLIADNNNVEDYVKIPIHVDFVNNYGKKESYIDIQGIKNFIDWRPEYKDAIFECGNGVYHKGLFNSREKAMDTHLITQSEVGKMSKRYFNVVNPDVIVEKYGADCFRMYEMFLGPIEQSKPWDTQGIEGVSKFLKRFHSLFFNENTFLVTDNIGSKEAYKILHKTIKKVRSDIEAFSHNTAISHFMVLTNELKKLKCHSKEILEPFVILLAPFAPFITEHLWKQLGHTTSVHHASYPTFDERHLVEDSIEYPLCFNGKKRSTITLASNLDNTAIETEARNVPNLDKWLDGKTILKVIVVPNKMINFVVK